MINYMEKKDPRVFQVIQKIWGGLKCYLKDWRNLLGHALLGIVLLVLAIWAPINIWIKLALMAYLIVFNIFRMRRKARKTFLQDTTELKKER